MKCLKPPPPLSPPIFSNHHHHPFMTDVRSKRTLIKKIPLFSAQRRLKLSPPSFHQHLKVYSVAHTTYLVWPLLVKKKPERERDVFNPPFRRSFLHGSLKIQIPSHFLSLKKKNFFFLCGYISFLLLTFPQGCTSSHSLSFFFLAPPWSSKNTRKLIAKFLSLSLSLCKAALHNLHRLHIAVLFHPLWSNLPPPPPPFATSSDFRLMMTEKERPLSFLLPFFFPLLLFLPSFLPSSSARERERERARELRKESTQIMKGGAKTFAKD